MTSEEPCFNPYQSSSQDPFSEEQSTGRIFQHLIICSLLLLIYTCIALVGHYRYLSGIFLTLLEASLFGGAVVYLAVLLRKKTNSIAVILHASVWILLFYSLARNVAPMKQLLAGFDMPLNPGSEILFAISGFFASWSHFIPLLLMPVIFFDAVVYNYLYRNRTGSKLCECWSISMFAIPVVIYQIAIHFTLTPLMDLMKKLT